MKDSSHRTSLTRATSDRDVHSGPLCETSVLKSPVVMMTVNGSSGLGVPRSPTFSFIRSVGPVLRTLLPSTGEPKMG